jgi:hypothetical protein
MAEISQIVQTIYLYCNSSIPDAMMPWLVIICMSVGVVLLLFFKEQATRRALDI